MQEVYSNHLIQKQETFSGGASRRTYTTLWDQKKSSAPDQSTSATNYVVIRGKPTSGISSDSYFVVKINTTKARLTTRHNKPYSWLPTESIIDEKVTKKPYHQNLENYYKKIVNYKITDDVHENTKNNLKLIILKTKEARNEIHDLLSSLYSIKMDSSSPTDLEVLYKKLSVFIENERYGACNKLLTKLEVERAPTLILIGIPRRLFSIKTRLENWDNTISTIRSELDNRGLNAESMLKGIIA